MAEAMADAQTIRTDPIVEQNSTVAEIVRRLVGLYHPQRIYLFGSTARGAAGPDSDYDFMVLVADDTPRELIRTKEVYSVLRGIEAPIDVIVWTRSRFDSRLHLKASFPSTIVREGRMVYAA